MSQTTSAEPSEPRVIVWFDRLVSRVAATIIWLWVFARWPGPSVLEPLLRIPFLLLLVSSIGVLLIHVALKSEWSHIIGAVFSAAFYVLFWPLGFPLTVPQSVRATLNALTRASHRWPGTVLIYAASAFLIYATIEWPAATYIMTWVPAVALVLAITVVLAVGAWTLEPLPISLGLLQLGPRIAMWTVDHQHTLPSVEDLRRPTKEAPGKLASYITAAVNAHKSFLDLPDTAAKEFTDLALLVAFCRTFIIAILLLSALFACAHLAVAQECGNVGCAYSGFREHARWLDYAYFSLMTTLSGNRLEQPLSSGAKLLVSANALCGIALLVILVMSFSLLSRERLRRRIANVLDASQAGLKDAKSKILHAAFFASSGDSMTEEIRTKLIPAARVACLEEQDEFALRGTLLYQGLIEQTKASANASDLASLLTMRRRFTVADYADLHREAGCPDPDQIPPGALASFHRVADRVPQ